jgi:hypothetical protein
LEDLDEEVEINSASTTIREKRKISAKERLKYFELKKHELCFDEECSECDIEENKLNCSAYRIQMK